MAVESNQGTAPWESVPAHEQLFVLVTGANSGVGLGFAQRLIDDFLATRSLDAHLVILATTRSVEKSRQAIREIRAHAVRTAQVTAPLLRARAGDRIAQQQEKQEEEEEEDGAGRGTDRLYTWEDSIARVHVLSLPLDLCDLAGVRAFARRLARGRVSNPASPGEYLIDVRVPRLDSVVFNAAYGGWAGCNYPMAVWSILRKGLVQSVTWPDFKNALPTRILNEQRTYGYPEKPLLGEVFAACVFGHYLLAHDLLPLLSRRASSGLAPGRIVWSSSLEAVADVFSVDDLQGLTRANSYESAKRLTDILALTSGLPAVRPFSSRWLAADDVPASTAGTTLEKQQPQQQPVDETTLVPPKVYLSHPGIVASTLFPVPWFLFWAYELALVVSRWLGSPWHCVDGYTGAAAAVWLSLQGQEMLDESGADRVKWGSSADRHGRVDVKKTEVEGWGWEGRPEDADALAADTAVGVLRKSLGRKYGAVDVTSEDIMRFEELGAACWKEMEELRATWEDIIEDNDVTSISTNGKMKG